MIRLIVTGLIGLLLSGGPSMGGIRERPKIGLVLGAGGVKGLAHIPVLQMLDNLQIPIDCIAGTSIGGIVGALYASGYSGDQIAALARGLDWENLFRDAPPRARRPYFIKKDDGKYQFDLRWRDWIPSPPQGLIVGQKITELLSELTYPHATVRDFNRLPIPFRCVAVDLATGKRVVLGSGSLARSMRATMAIPTVFSPVAWDDALLVDGGILNTLPVDVVRDMGAQVVIAVDLTSPLKDAEDLASADGILGQSVLVVEHDHRRRFVDQVDILIHPDMTDLSSMDFFSESKRERIWEAGRLASLKAEAELEALKNAWGLFRSEVPKVGAQPERRLVGIRVEGLSRLNRDFILGQFSLRPGDLLTAEGISRAIEGLYALGYFEHVRYELLPSQENEDLVDLILRIKELPSGRLRLGLRYDKLHKTVGVIGMDFSNRPIPGLRFESELTVLGQTRLRSRLYYPSRTLNLPMYPILQLDFRNVATRIFDPLGERVAGYNDRGWILGVGIGLLPIRWLNAEVFLQREFMNLKPTSILPDADLLPDFQERLNQVAVTFTFDALDDLMFPDQGVLVKAGYEGSYAKLDSDRAYEKLAASCDGYLTLADRHTCRLYAFFGRSWGDIPYYKFFNQGRPHMFVGMNYDQLYGSRMTLLRAEYRFRYTDFLSLSIMANTAWDFALRTSPEVGSPTLWGLGIGGTIDTPLGIMELIYSIGSRSLLEPGKARDVVYLTMGTRF